MILLLSRTIKRRTEVKSADAADAIKRAVERQWTIEEVDGVPVLRLCDTCGLPVMQGDAGCVRCEGGVG